MFQIAKKSGACMAIVGIAIGLFTACVQSSSSDSDRQSLSDATSGVRDAAGGMEDSATLPLDAGSAELVDTVDFSPELVSPAAAAACAGLGTETFGASARGFMQAQGMIREGEESDAGGGILSQWHMQKVQAIPMAYAPISTCAVVMNLSLISGNLIEAGQLFEVLAYRPDLHSFHRFETQVQLPPRVYVGIASGVDELAPDGTLTRGNDDHFYLALEGQNLIEAYKVISTGIRAAVFSGALSATLVPSGDGGRPRALPDGKLAFDPTPRRTWKVKNVRIDLRRGYTPEILDVNPGLIDSDFEGAYFGPGEGGVAPWNHSQVRKWRLPDERVWHAFVQEVHDR